MTSSKFAILGLPASGKTTFLAALWHLIESGETPSQLKLLRYEGDKAYLSLIAEAWRKFEKVPRTSQHGETSVVIELAHANTGEEAVIHFPDLAGESFDVQIENRRCRPEYIEQIAQEEGILLFITANTKEDDLSIVELTQRLPPGLIGPAAPGQPARGQAAPQLPAPAGPDPGGNERAQPSAAEWQPKDVPAQVRIVQLLTDLGAPPFATRRRKLVVIISAWDLTAGSGATPSSWLASNMPLVDQFLQTNRAAFDYKLYGISAQGVRLDDHAAVEEAANDLASRRIRVVADDATETNDLTTPIIWLMSKA